LICQRKFFLQTQESIGFAQEKSKCGMADISVEKHRLYGAFG